MFIFFLALFTIALVGLSILFVFKFAETRTGKTLFLPLWLQKKDGDIEKIAKQLIRLSVVNIQKFLYKQWRFLISISKNIFVRLREIRRGRKKEYTEHNGTGSMYFKQMIEHKNQTRHQSPNTKED